MEVEASNGVVIDDTPVKPAAQPEKTSADYYFDSYSHFGIHEEMLKDGVRTRSYMNAILNNSHQFKGKVVLDIGCGTGILSLFCASAGAKHVYGIECSAIADQATQIVKDNKFQDVITIVRGKVESVTLPVQHVDIIVSEWMGYFLFYESMLDTVIYARDKWLAPGGVLLPDKATLHMCGIEDGDYKHEKIDYWDNVYGFNFSCIKALAMTEPLVDCVDQQQICTNTTQVISLDLATMRKEDASFRAAFSLTASRNDFIHALVVYFDVTFSAGHKPVYFSTSPRNKSTHWKQTVFYLEDVVTICQGETLNGYISSKPNINNPRDLDIEISYTFNGKHCVCKRSQQYRMR